MLLQDYLRGGGTPAELAEKFAIKTRRHEKHANLVQFKYDQINSPLREALVQECRGVILDEAENWNVVARAFDKFFNHGDPLAATIDWSTARVQEKVDGSLCVLYHFNSEWHVATTGTPDASGDVNGCGILFRDLFWRTFKAMGLALPDGHTNKAFLFELTSPWNRVVVRHADERLVLLGIRRRDGKWYDPEGWGYPAVKSYPLGSFEEILASFQGIDPLSQEGYVVVDGSFNRVKCKHPGYVALHHMKGDGLVSPRRVLEILLAGESTEVLTAFPEWAPYFTEASDKLVALASAIDSDYARLKPIPIQKDFALEAVKTRCSAALFQLRQGRIKSADEYLRAMTTDRLADVLDLKSPVGITTEAA